MRRAILVILLVIAVLFALAAAGVQMVLWSDLPRTLVDSALEDATGLEISIAEMRTGWNGETSLRQVSVTLPLENQSFLDIPEIDVSHAGLVSLLLTQSLDLQEVRVRRPLVHAREYEDGDWNLARVIDVVRGAQQPTDAPSAVGPLPAVRLDDATVVVTPWQEDPITFDDVQFTGARHGELGWAFELRRDPEIRATGRLMPRPPMRHEVAFDVRDIQSLLAPWLESNAEALRPKRLAGSWEGRVVVGGVAGRLRIDEAAAGEHELSGEAGVRIAEGRTTVTFNSIVARSPALGGGTVHLDSGRAVLEPQRLALEQVVAAGHGARAMIDGEWNLGRRRGDATVAWTGVGADAGLPWLGLHNGSLSASIAMPQVGPITFDSTIEVDASTGPGSVTATLVVSASGPAWTRLSGRLRFPTLQWRDEQGVIDASGFAFDAGVDWPRLRADEFVVPGPATAAGDATYAFDTNQWRATFEATDWKLPRTIDQPVDLDFDARGDLVHVDFTRLHVANEQVDLLASGRYMPHEAESIVAQATLKVDRPFELGEPGETEGEPADGTDRPDTRLASELNVRGSVAPLDIAYDGQLSVFEFPVGERMVHELTLPWSGVVGEASATFRGEEFPLFGGRWTLSGDLDYDPQNLIIHLDGGGVPVSELLAIVEVPLRMDGVVAADIDMRVPGLEMSAMQIDGDWRVVDLQTDRFAAARGRGRVRMRDQRLQLRDIRLERGEGWIEGSGEFDLKERRQLALDLTARQWPVALERADLRLAIDGKGDVTIDVTDETARGDLNLRTDLFLGEQSFGSASIDASVDKRDIRLDRFRATLLDGELEASGSVTVGEWLTARVSGNWREIDLARLGAFAPAIEGLEGVSSGRLAIAKSTDPRALGPLRLDVESRIAGGRFRETLEIDGFDLHGYADPQRVILDRGGVGLADGRLGLWARSQMHGDRRYGHGLLFVENLELDQLLRAVNPDLSPTPGRLNGRITVGSYLGALDRSFGTGEIYLSDADLGTLPVFDFLYNLLRLEFSPEAAPTGYGLAEVRLEGTTLEISRLEYFNRGTDVAGSLTVADLTMGGESPIDGVAVGAVRPFRDLDLPLFGDLDRLVAALQTDAVAVEIDGTLADREVRQAVFADVGATIQRILSAGISGE